MTKQATPKVRVRVRPGHTLKVSRTKVAREGEWTELDPCDLDPQCATRRAVETEEDIAAAAAAQQTAVVADAEKWAANRVMFETLRQGAIEHNRAAARANVAHERHDAAELAVRADERVDSLGGPR